MLYTYFSVGLMIIILALRNFIRELRKISVYTNKLTLLQMYCNLL